MRHINRSIAIIYPKTPFIDWANNLPDAESKTTEELRDDATAILISEYDTKDEARETINKIYENIFEYELWAWCTNEAYWPKHRTKEMFGEWFDVEFHSEVLDVYDYPNITEGN